MPGAKKTRAMERAGLKDTIILLILWKGRTTWDVVATGRNMETIEKIKSFHDPKIDQWKLATVSGETGKIKNL